MIRYGMVVLIYGVFLGSAGSYLVNVIRYRGVQFWPSVSAELLRAESGSVMTPVQTRYGSGEIVTDTGYVEFRYTVDGVTYRSTRSTPDGGGLLMDPFNRPLRAYYNPSSPEVAVLSPIPYQGVAAGYTAAFTGILVAIHLWFTIPSLFYRYRYAIRRQSHANPT
jgi:hypothetical protein